MVLHDLQKGLETVTPGIGLYQIIHQLELLSQRSFPNNEVKAVLAQLDTMHAELEPYTFYASNCYTRNRVYKSAFFELILMCWQAGQSSPIHGHEGQKCWMYVAEGSLEFTNYQDIATDAGIKLQKIATVVGGRGFVDGPAYIHGVANIAEYPALSLHLYASPFTQCDAYDISAQNAKKIQLCYYSIEGKRLLQEPG